MIGGTNSVTSPTAGMPTFRYRRDQEFAPGVAEDFEPIADPLRQHDSQDAVARAGQIIGAIDALGHNPLIGRSVAGRKRELIIGRDARGYVALYSYAAALDTVLVLAVRGQRETGCAPDPPVT